MTRYHAYLAYSDGFVEDEQGNRHELTAAERGGLHDYLQNVGAFPNEETDK